MLNNKNKLFTVLTVSIGYNHFLKEWADAVSKLQTKPDEILIGVDNIDFETKKYIDNKLNKVKWISLKKRDVKHFGEYYNEVINEVETEWVCKIDADDLILREAYDELHRVEEDIFAFGCTSSLTREDSVPPVNISPIKILESTTNLLSSLSPFRKKVWLVNKFKDYYFDDWIFWVDAASSGFTFASSNKSNYVYRDHKMQATKKIDKLREESTILNYKFEKRNSYYKSLLNLKSKKLLFFHSYPLKGKNFGHILNLVRILSLEKTNKIYLTFCNGENIQSCETNPLMDREICAKCMTRQKHASKQLSKPITFIDINYEIEKIQDNKQNFMIDTNITKEKIAKALAGITKELNIDKLFYSECKSECSKINNSFEISSELEFKRKIRHGKNLSIEDIAPAEDQFIGENENLNESLIFNGIDLDSNLEYNFSKEIGKIQKGFRSALNELQRNKKYSLLVNMGKLFFKVESTINRFKEQFSKYSKKNKIIYDIGANDGANIEYYLTKANKVIAVEANPLLCSYMEKKFRNEIELGRLIVVNTVVSDTNGLSKIFYVHRKKSELSSYIKPDIESLDNYETIHVDSISPTNLINRFGSPFFVKIDVEGSDEFVLYDLIKSDIFPKYLSVELHKYNVINIINKVGNIFKFQIIDFANNKYSQNISYSYSAGPFGTDLPNVWLGATSLNKSINQSGLGWKDLHIKFSVYTFIKYRLKFTLKKILK
jgi:FkbM family methyltransferase